jgi:hypothetical protein
MRCEQLKQTQMYVYKVDGCFSSAHFCEDCKSSLPLDNPMYISPVFIQQQHGIY